MLLPLLLLLVITCSTPSSSAPPEADGEDQACHAGDDALRRARLLSAPLPLATSGAEFEGSEFWELHAQLLSAAWHELGLANASLATLQPFAVDPALRTAAEAARRAPGPATEATVKSLFTELTPGVWSGRLLSDAAILLLRRELQHMADSGIPTRRPNGMNRYGLILDGGVGVAGLDRFFDALIDQFVRPLASTFFPADIGRGDTVERLAFTVRYRSGEDVALAEHRDASVVTLNLNLNTQDETYGGSELYFVPQLLDDETAAGQQKQQQQQQQQQQQRLAFGPGQMLLHRGALRHAALPIEAGERTNLIIWMFGEGGDVRVAPYPPEQQLTARQRWRPTVSVEAPGTAQRGYT